jgi:hypothetical protein
MGPCILGLIMPIREEVWLSNLDLHNPGKIGSLNGPDQDRPQERPFWTMIVMFNAHFAWTMIEWSTRAANQQLSLPFCANALRRFSERLFWFRHDSLMVSLPIRKPQRLPRSLPKNLEVDPAPKQYRIILGAIKT